MNPLTLILAVTISAAAVVVIIVAVARLGRLGQSIEGRLETQRAELTQGLLREFAQTQERVAESLRVGRQEQGQSITQLGTSLETRFNELRKATEAKLQEIRNEVDRKLSDTVTKNAEHFKAVGEQLTRLGESTGRIVSLSRDVHDLNVLLKAPKSRGAFGEMGLEQMLADVLGDFGNLFATQYSLGDGRIADAVIFISPQRDQVVCIDAKFPRAHADPLLGTIEDAQVLAAEQRAFAGDVRNQAKSIRDKYIAPPKTLDYAFMFVPAESIYYLVMSDRKLHEDLLRMRVVPVGPNTFYATLNALAYAYRGVRIQQSARELEAGIAHLAREFERFARDYELVGKHLANATSKFEDTQKDMERFTQGIARLKQAELDMSEEQPRSLPADEDRV
jgi:DNA recombination protein RmuC